MKLEITSFDIAPQALNDWACQIADSQKSNEIFLLARLFEKSNDSLPFDFPITIELNESPDFILHQDNSCIGLEVTEFRAEQRARAEHLASNNGTGLSLTPFDYDSPKRTNDEISSRIQQDKPGLSNWVSIDSRIDIHSAKITEIIEKKIHKVIDPSSNLFDEHWLVIDDRMFMGDLELNELLPRVQEHLNSQKETQSFNAIFFVFLNSVRGFRKSKLKYLPS